MMSYKNPDLNTLLTLTERIQTAKLVCRIMVLGFLIKLMVSFYAWILGIILQRIKYRINKIYGEIHTYAMNNKIPDSLIYTSDHQIKVETAYQIQLLNFKAQYSVHYNFEGNSKLGGSSNSSVLGGVRTGVEQRLSIDKIIE